MMIRIINIIILIITRRVLLLKVVLINLLLAREGDGWSRFEVEFNTDFTSNHSTQYRLYSTILTSLHNFDTDTEKKSQ